MRIDKFLWCIRLYKTRSQATEACKGGKVLLNGQHTKPSSLVKPGDEIATRYESIYKRHRILQLPANRMAASGVPQYAEDITPADEIEKLRQIRLNKTVFRNPGTGRPTKKDRRDMHRFFNED